METNEKKLVSLLNEVAISFYDVSFKIAMDIAENRVAVKLGYEEKEIDWIYLETAHNCCERLMRRDIHAVYDVKITDKGNMILNFRLLFDKNSKEYKTRA